MSKVDEGIKLVVTCGVFFNPWSIWLECAPVVCLFKVSLITGKRIEFPCCQFHVINIVIFLVEIGRHVACRLCGTGVSKAKFKRISGP